jgi:VWFA-related protein
VVTALSSLLGVLALAQERREVPSFASKVEIVTVDAVVQDAEGRPVRGLTAADFTLLEDGQPQTIASFEAVDLGAAPPAAPTRTVGPMATNSRAAAAVGSYVLLIDDLGLAPTRQEVVRTALARFLETSLRDGDEIIFATTSGDAWWSARMPEGREDLRALSGRVRGRNLADSSNDTVSEWEAHRIENFEGSGDGGGTGGPPALPPTQPGVPSASVPGATLTERVIDRYYMRRVCIPDIPPCSDRPMTSLAECRGRVRARAQQVNQRRVDRTRGVLAAVDRAIFALTGLRGRKALLLFTEGFLNDSGLDAIQQVAGRCREANLVLYSMDVRGLMTGGLGADAGMPSTSPNQAGAMRIEETDLVAGGSVGLAEDTGGFAVRNTNDLAAGAARVAEESRTYYLLGYSPPEGKGSRDWRQLKVTVNRPALQVRARKGYTLRTTAEIEGAARHLAGAKLGDAKPGAPTQDVARIAEPARLPAEVARTLVNARGADAIPLRAMAYALEGRPAGTVRTILAIETDTRSVANVGEVERPQSVLSLSILATHRDSGKTQRIDQHVVVDSGRSKSWEGWLAMNREFDLPPGVAQARVVVRDEFLGRVGAVTVRFVVPEAAGLRIGTPILTDRLLTTPGGAAQPVLTAHREFASSANLYCQFQVFGAGASSPPGPVIEASYELRRASGAVLRQGADTAIARSVDGRLVRMLAFTLDGMGAGDYELVLRVHDTSSGQKQERIEPLRIVSRLG